eukprot:4155932-Prymnesium_polylepis.1
MPTRTRFECRRTPSCRRMRIEYRGLGGAGPGRAAAHRAGVAPASQAEGSVDIIQIMMISRLP